MGENKRKTDNPGVVCRLAIHHWAMRVRMSGSLGLTLAVSNKSKPTQKQNQSNLTENKQPQMFWRHILNNNGMMTMTYYKSKPVGEGKEWESEA